MAKTRGMYDFTYGCFLFCGVSILLIYILGIIPIPMDSGAAGYIGFLVLIPLSMVSLLAMVFGIGASIWLYHHRPFVIMSILSVLLIAEVIYEYGPVSFYNMSPLFYGVITCILSLKWFFRLRSKWSERSNKCN